MSTEDFLTLDDLADYLNVNDMPLARANMSLAGAQAQVRTYLQQLVTRSTSSVEIDGTGKNTVRLRERPVRQVMSVNIDGVTVEEHLYVLRGAFLRLRRGYVFPRGTLNVEVIYDHGWDVEQPEEGAYLPVPADIKLVALSVASRRYRAIGTDPTLRGETIGQYSYQRDTEASSTPIDLLPAEAAVLDRYAVRLVP